MPSSIYTGPDRREHLSRLDNGAQPFGRRTIDRISRPQSVLPNWAVLLIMLGLLYLAIVLLS